MTFLSVMPHLYTADVEVEPYNHPAGHRRAYVSDPDGNWIAVVSK